MKNKFKYLMLCLLCFPLIGSAQPKVTEVPLNHEQIVINDKIIFSIIDIHVANEINVHGNIIKPEEGLQLVVVKLGYTGKIATKFVLRPNDFVAMYGDVSIYMTTSVAAGTGSNWITNEFADILGKMSVTMNVKPGVINDGLEVAFKLPKTISNFSLMSKTVSSLGSIVIPN